MNVIDLVQSLEWGARVACSPMTMPLTSAKSTSIRGDPARGLCSIAGNEAVFKVLRWTEGNFQIDFNGKSSEETTTLNTQGLLMEGLRLLDEAQRDEAVEGEDVLLDT